MNYIALYRKWRPMTFDEVVEQGNVVTILKNSVKSRRIAHAYLFCGTRGTGKTSIAKIFSRAINCLNPVDGNPCNQCEICKGILNESLLDVSEIDAASNNGIENIRQIIDDSSYQATKAEFKVFIIDEVHMLSTAAFNALLKTLEEPPENVVFILATTEPHKLPVTILSRCQRYDFKRISREGIAIRLEEICNSMNLEYEEPAMKFLAGKADGALRDAISLLDQTIASSEDKKITLNEVRKAVGSLDRDTLEKFANAIIQRDCFTVLSLVDHIFSEGADPLNFICELIDLFREMLVVLSTRNPGNLIYETGEDLERLKKLAESSNIKEISLFIRELAELENSLKWAVQRKIIFEAGMLSLCDRNWSKETELNDRIQTLERSVADLATKGIKLAYSGQMPKISSGSSNIEETKEEPIGLSMQEIETPEETEMPTADDLKEADRQDWNDFISNLIDANKNALASLLQTFGRGYQIGRVLYISFENEMLFKNIKMNDLQETMDTAASAAFGKKLKVIVETSHDFVKRIPGLVDAAENGKETEEDKKIRDAEEALQKMIENGGDLPETLSEKPTEEPAKDDSFEPVIEEEHSFAPSPAEEYYAPSEEDAPPESDYENEEFVDEESDEEHEEF